MTKLAFRQQIVARLRPDAGPASCPPTMRRHGIIFSLMAINRISSKVFCIGDGDLLRFRS